jgi:hypothetical protein
MTRPNNALHPTAARSRGRSSFALNRRARAAGERER